MNEYAAFKELLANGWEPFVSRYTFLEKRVQTLMGHCCGPICAVCTSTCCRPDICEETQDSLFLRLLRHHICPQTVFDDRYGWLDINGCVLPCARPPVCYEFFCDELLQDARLPIAPELLLAAGHIPSFTGRQALGQRHLVDLQTVEEMQRVQIPRLLARIDQAEQVLAALESPDDNTPPEPKLSRLLEKIRPGRHECCPTTDHIP
jgi:hypothetical protein